MSTQEPLPPPGSGQGDTSKTEEVKGTAQQEGKQLAQSAKQEARSVGHTAQEQASRVAGDAIDQAGDLVSSAVSQLEDKAEEQTHKLAGAIRNASEQARALADGRADEAGEIDGYVRQVAGTLGDIAERIDRLGARGSIEELQHFARRRPGAFLAGAAAAGLLTSRFVRNSGDTGNGAGSSGQGSPTGRATAQIPPTTTPASPAGATTGPTGATSGPATTGPTGATTGPATTPPPPTEPAVTGPPRGVQNTGGPTGGSAERGTGGR